MRVCYFGTYRAEYSRNQIMIAGLRAAGVEVIECQVSLWKSIEDRVEIAGGGWASFAFLKRVLSTYRHLWAKYAALDKEYDVMVLGYPGQLDALLACLLSWRHGKPLVLDLFMSIYLIAVERGLDKKSRLSIHLLYWLEWFVCRLPDLLICDTAIYAAWHQKKYGLKPEKFRLVPTGADDRVYHKPPSTASSAGESLFRVLYYGTYIPNHNVPVMVEAVRLLQNEPDLRFIFIGQGPQKETALAMVQEYGLTNITFIDWVEREELPHYIERADICLGAFGRTPQSEMTIQNKIYEAMAMGKAIITGDSPAIRSSLRPGEDIYLCERDDPQALAEAIQTLKENPAWRKKLAANAYRLFYEQFDVAHNGERFRNHLEESLRNR